MTGDFVNRSGSPRQAVALTTDGIRASNLFEPLEPGEIDRIPLLTSGLLDPRSLRRNPSTLPQR